MAQDSTPIEVGGEYVENPDFVPNLTDQVAQYNTSGTGAHQKVEEIAPVFEVDKVKTAEEIKAALDPDNTNVSESKVLLPDPLGDNDAALERAHAAADARIAKGVVIGGPTPAEREAALEGDEGEQAAVSQERDNTASNSTGVTNAGRHTSAEDPGATGAQTVGVSGADSVTGADGDDGGDEDAAPAKSANKDEWLAYARKQGATDEDLAGDAPDGYLTKDQLADKYGD